MVGVSAPLSGFDFVKEIGVAFSDCFELIVKALELAVFVELHAAGRYQSFYRSCVLALGGCNSGIDSGVKLHSGDIAIILSLSLLVFVLQLCNRCLQPGGINLFELFKLTVPLCYLTLKVLDLIGLGAKICF